MKKFFLFFLVVFVTSISAFSQDTLIRLNDERIICKIQKEDAATVNFTLYKNGKKFDTFIDKSEIKSIKYGNQAPTQTVITDKVSLGAGLGMDFGGLGVNLLVYPHRNIGLFGCVGYAMAGTGYNIGTKIRFVSENTKSKATFYGLAMYGYNAAIAVTNATEYNKLFYGPTLGFGFDYKSHPSKRGYWTFCILLPIRSTEVDDYINDLKDHHSIEFKNELMPIGITMGYRIILN
jgi:hypothetical protein